MLRVLEVAQHGIVTPEIVIIGGLSQQRRRTLQQDRLGLPRAAQFVQAEGAVDVTRRLIRRDLPQGVADGKRIAPAPRPHQDEQLHLKDLDHAAGLRGQLIELTQGLLGHLEFEVSLSGKQRPFG